MSATFFWVVTLVLIAFAAVEYILRHAASVFDRAFDLGEPDAHAQLVDDMHLAKVARMADAMKTDREKALDRMADNARDIGLDYSKDGA